MRTVPTLTPILLVVATLLGACVPGAQLISAPTFALVPSESGLVRLDPPGIGSGQATFRLALDVANPNPVGVRLAGLEGTLLIDGRRAADTVARNGIDLPAGGTGRLVLDTSLPLVGAAELIADLAGIVVGEPTEIQLDAVVTVSVFGADQRLPSATLLRSTIEQPLRVASPAIALDRERSGLRAVGATGATLVLALDVTNPNPLGFGLSAPALELSLSGRTVAVAELAATPLPALATTGTELELRLDFAALGPALAAQVGLAAAGSGRLEIALDGPLLLEAPGILTVPLDPARLLDTSL